MASSMMDPKHMAKMIMARKMAKGGCYAEGGPVDDFLSANESDEGPGGEGEIEEDREDMNRSDLLGRILSRIHASHMGK